MSSLAPLQDLFDATAGEDIALPSALARLYGRLRVPRHTARPHVIGNIVTSLDGSISGPDGRSGSINTSSDQHVFAVHRALADAVVVAGGTARHEGYRAVDLAPWQQAIRTAEGLAPLPTLVVVTRTGRLDPMIARPAEGAGGPVVVATTAGNRAADLDPLREAGVEVLELGTGEVDLVGLVDELAGRGLPRLLCEGGPHLHRDLLAAGLVDELSLTLAPVVVGGDGPRTTTGEDLPETLGFVLQFALLGDDGALFTSYRRQLPEG